jgi:hypothetical protein
MKTNERSDTQPCTSSAYILDNAGRETPARFDALSTMYDRGTIQYLENCGIGPGWTCLEVGVVVAQSPLGSPLAWAQLDMFLLQTLIRVFSMA